MSPELISPDIQDYRRTKYSDCYALGMVVYEVLSGLLPFHRHPNLVVVGKVVGGERPERPQAAWFTDDVWEMLERCWAPKPANRPGAGDMLQYLEDVSRSWIPPSPRSSAVSSTAGPLTWEFSDIITAESLDSSGVLSPSQEALPQSSERLDLEESAGIVNRVG